MNFFDRISIKKRLLSGYITVVLTVTAFSIGAISYSVSTSFKEELRLRAIYTARNIASRTKDPLLINDRLALHDMIMDEKELCVDVAYIMLLDNKNNPIVHTFGNKFPLPLLSLNAIETKTNYRVELFILQKGGQAEQIYDVAAPIVLGKRDLGLVRVGFRLKPTMKKIYRAIGLVAVMCLIAVTVCVFIAGFIARRITTPLTNLAAVAEELSSGQLRPLPGMENKPRCWEIMKCEEKDCPAHEEKLIPCWYIAGTLCQAPVKGVFARKLGNCKKCKYYKKYFGSEIEHLAGALFYMAYSLIQQNKERKKHLNELTLINQIIKDLSSKLNKDDLLSSIVESASKALEADAGAIAIYDEKTQTISYPFFYNMPEKLAKVIVPKGGGLAGLTMERRKSILLENYPAHPNAVPEFVESGLKNLLTVPLVAGDKVLGALGVFGLDPEKRFKRESIPVLRAIGDEAAIALDNARLYEELRKSTVELETRVMERTKQISTLYSISRKLSVELDLNKTLNSLLEEAAKALDAGSGAILILNYEENMGRGKYFDARNQSFGEFSLSLDQGIPAHIIRHGKTLRITNAPEQFKDPDPLIERLSIKSFLTMPIKKEGRVIAIIGLHDKTSREAFDKEDEEFLASISDQIATAIEKCTLYEDLKNRTAQLQAANEQLAELNRLKSEFLANVSHELRTPLNSIIGFSGVILQGLCGEINSEQKKQLTMVYKSAQHLLELINDVLDMSKIEAGEMKIVKECFDINELIKESLEAVSLMAEAKGLILSSNMSPRSLEVCTDRARVRQVLFNLLGNAVKFTHDGYIEVSSFVDKERKNLVITVSDTGVGIKQRDLEGVFDMFKQAHGQEGKKPEGTGLGLSISRKIVHLLGGDMWVESKYGLGSRFFFTLPLKRP